MAVSQDQRATLENMARTWEALAADRERLIDRGKRISELESDPNSKR
jgi:hypothetical protein